jgi:hypothetical protein
VAREESVRVSQRRRDLAFGVTALAHPSPRVEIVLDQHRGSPSGPLDLPS